MGVAFNQNSALTIVNLMKLGVLFMTGLWFCLQYFIVPYKATANQLCNM